MKQNTYMVYFEVKSENQPITVHAFNEREAVILAQAERIKNGLTYEVHDVVEVWRNWLKLTEGMM